MAAQARHYEKSITYSSRQVDDNKYISNKNRHSNSTSHLKSADSSPYNRSSKTNSHLSSPSGGRKRPYNNSPNSSKSSNSPYESIRKKDRIDNDMGKNDCEISLDTRCCEDDETGMKRSHCHRCPVNGYIKDDNEWSQHLSSSGKIYYYNRRTEESQWEVPKGWNERDQDKDAAQKERSARESLNFSKESNSREDFRDTRDVRGDTKDYKYKEKTNSKDYNNRVQESRNYRDSRKTREKDSREFWDNFKERDYRDRDSRDNNDKHRVTPGSSKRDSIKYNSPSIRTVGQSTPSSSTTHSRSYRRPTPDSLNGSESVQDISPPGTPTNDDIVNNISTISPAPLYTPHSCSPHISTTLTTSRLPLPTTPHTPLLSPILLTSTGHLSTSYLHPLQQALLLQQQQATTNKDNFGSPKLPTVKNHILHSVGSTPSSPMTTSNHKNNSMLPSPDLTNRNATPPPPPPPLRVSSESKDRNSIKQERLTMQQTPTSERLDHHENHNRSKSFDYQAGDTPLRTSYKSFNTDRLIKRTIKLEKEESVLFQPLPDLNKYTEHFAPSVADLNTSFYCNSLENQISSSWEETMMLLHSDGYRSKFNLSICRQHADSHDSKLDVSSRWVDALNAVILKVESLQDASMKSEARVARDTKSPAVRKSNKSESNNHNNSNSNNNSNSYQKNSEPPPPPAPPTQTLTPKMNGVKNDIKDVINHTKEKLNNSINSSNPLSSNDVKTLSNHTSSSPPTAKVGSGGEDNIEHNSGLNNHEDMLDKNSSR